MSAKAPASAALLSQAQALGPDLAPFIQSGSLQPSAQGTPEPPSATDSIALAQEGLPLGASTEVVPADHAVATLSRSWTELVAGQVGSRRRFASFLVAALVVSTLVRSACFTQAAFGPFLLDNLAPVERDTVRWKFIVANRAWEVTLGAWVWQRLSGVVRGEGGASRRAFLALVLSRLVRQGTDTRACFAALFGVLLALVARLSLYGQPLCFGSRHSPETTLTSRASRPQPSSTAISSCRAHSMATTASSPSRD